MTTIWHDPGNAEVVHVIDQRQLPHYFVTAQLGTAEEVAAAIRDMTVRGAPLIGVAAGYGVYLAAVQADKVGAPDDMRADVMRACDLLLASRPTAVNLRWALDEQRRVVEGNSSPAKLKQELLENANRIRQMEIEIGESIGRHGLQRFREIERRSGTLNILTHCNAGWLCSVEWGTATAPIYMAHAAGLDVHVWVDETRPRNQGASLTAWELGKQNVPYTLIADNTGGHLMQQGLVDAVIVGTDRVAANGDVANKIGTYLKALAAKDNGVPFFVAAPSSSIDWTIDSGAKIPIEQREAEEVKYMTGIDGNGQQSRVLICPENANVANYGFDVTPARLITGIITERGICEASAAGLRKLFPEHAKVQHA